MTESKTDDPPDSKLRRLRYLFLIPLSCFYVVNAAAAPSIRAVYTDNPPTIDGALDDAAWAAAEPATEFAQYRPTYGNPPSEATEVRILYDYTTLYLAFDCSIANTGEIIGSETQRDEGFFFPLHEDAPLK